MHAKRNEHRNNLTRTIGGVSGKFKKLVEVYRIFAKDWEHLFDFSDEMIVELYNCESFGLPVSEKNGYYLGKKWMDVQIKMWKEDLQVGIISKYELYEDETFPRWWLEKVLD